MIRSILGKIKFWRSADRIGPDMILTHWKLHFNSTMVKFCKGKFRHFDDTAEFRPGAYAVACSRISIGKNVVIRPGCNLSTESRDEAEIIIEDDVMLGPGVHIYTNNHKFDNPSIPVIQQGDSPSKKVVLKKGCWIGANAILLPGVTIGENSVIGAGAIVTKTIPPRVLAAGNPATILRHIA